MMISVGSILKNAREQKNISLHDVEKQIKVRVKYIFALENDDWSLFTSKVYINGILRNYARFLHLDEKKIVAFFRREYEKKEDVHFKKRISNRYFSPDSKKVLRIAVVSVSLLLFFYFAYQIFLFVRPPTIQLVKPNKTVFYRESVIQIVGKTEKEAIIRVSGERVYQDENGVFEYLFPLKQQKNDLLIEVIGANGKKATLKKTLQKLN